MNEAPLVQYMILCEDARFEGSLERRLDLFGLILRLNTGGRPFPVVFRNLCAVVALRNGRGAGTGQVFGVNADTGVVVCRTKPRRFNFGNDPIAFRGGLFRMNNSMFPAAGEYTFEFRYNGIVLAAQTFDVVGSQS